MKPEALSTHICTTVWELNCTLSVLLVLFSKNWLIIVIVCTVTIVTSTCVTSSNMVHTKSTDIILRATFNFTFVQETLKSLNLMHITMELIDLTGILIFTIGCDVLVVFVFDILISDSCCLQVLRKSCSFGVEGSGIELIL